MNNYEWDPDKAYANLVKHDVTFSDSTFVFEDERALTIEDDYPGERRFITIGTDAFGRILVVVYTYRLNIIRLISSRKANLTERTTYKGEA